MRFRGDELLIAFLLAALTACPSSPGRLSFAGGASGPSTLTARGANHAVALSWEPVDGATSYWVYRSTAPGARAAYQNLQAVPDPGQTWYVESDLENWQTYYFAVTASKDGAETLASPEASATPRDGTIACITFPAAAMTDTSVTLTGLLVGGPPGPSTQMWFEFAPVVEGEVVKSAASATGKVSYGAGYEVRAEVAGLGWLVGDTECWYRFIAQTVNADCAGTFVRVRTPRTAEVVASALDGPTGLVLGAKNVYLAERGADRIAKVAKSGGAVEAVAPADAPVAIAGGDAMLYAIEAGGILEIDPETLASAAVSVGDIGSYPSHLALAGSSLYWRSDEGIRAVPVAGGSPSSITSSWAGAFATDGSALYWSDVWSVWKVPLQPGSGPTKVASCAYCGGVVLASEWVYFYDAGAIYRVPASGGTREFFVSAPASWPGVADATDLYWIDTSSLLVRKMPLAGGPVTTLAYAPGLDGSSDYPMAVDATHVYWIAADGTTPPTGALLRTPKD